MSDDVGTLIITVGLPGVGKSTWVRGFIEQYASTGWSETILHVERDEIRKARGIEPGDFSREREVNADQEYAVRQGLYDHDFVIVADTNLRPKYRRRLVEIATEVGASVLYKVFRNSTNIDLVLERNRNREGTPEFVPEDVIRRMYEQFVVTGAWLQGIDKTEVI